MSFDIIGRTILKAYESRNPKMLDDKERGDITKRVINKALTISTE
jgi:hypothetical protein